MSDNTLIYTITAFDVVNKVLSVSFDDGSWARITLASPLPSSFDQVDSIVKQYASAVEHVQAKVEGTDLSFITNAIGIPRETLRKSTASNQPEQVAATEASIASTEEFALAEEARLRAFVLSILAEAAV